MQGWQVIVYFSISPIGLNKEKASAEAGFR
jgi:hypothetical protein